MAQEDVLTALATLDVENDDHWTEDGLPRVDVVAMLVPGVDRQAITAAAPGFSRTSPDLAFGNQDEQPAETSSQPQTEVAADPAVEELQEQMVAVQAKIAETNKHLAEGQKYLAELYAEEARIYDALQVETPAQSTQQVIGAYLERQRQERTAKAARMQELREAGLTPEVLAAAVPGQASKLDQALGQRKRQAQPLRQA